VEARTASRLDLECRRSFGELLEAAWFLYTTHFLVFAGVALIVVTPVDLVFYGLVAGDSSGGEGAASLGSILVAGPLITAMHMHAVQAVSEGRRPTLGRTLADGALVFLPVLVVMLLYWLSTVVGFILLIIPGAIVYVRCFVAPQAAVAEGVRGADALRRSWEITRGYWLRIALIVTATGLIGAVAAAVISIPFFVVEARTESDVVGVLTNIPIDAVTLSFTALVATLLFFDLRTRCDGPSGGS
jgi:hypothetical protein